MRNLMIAIAFLVAIISACFILFNEEKLTSRYTFTTPITFQKIILSKYIYAHQTFDALSEEQRIGQHVFLSLPSGSSNEMLSHLITTYHPGGILLFSYNIHSFEQTKSLITTLQTLAKEAGDPPLFIAVDEEGGIVERINFSPVPYSAFELGEMNEENQTRETARQTATSLSQLGFNVNFAPVADVAYERDSVMRERSFGNSPEVVTHHVEWIIDEFAQQNVAGTVKHFPGHGRTTTDSHFTLPIIPISKEEWLSTDAQPFIQAISQQVPFIMTGHILYPEVDSLPASSSSIWIKDVLREELGYRGITVSDDIKMNAYQSQYRDTAQQFLTAGNDMIIAAVNENGVISVTAGIDEFKQSNPEATRQALLRILAQKYSLYSTLP